VQAPDIPLSLFAALSQKRGNRKHKADEPLLLASAQGIAKQLDAIEQGLRNSFQAHTSPGNSSRPLKRDPVASDHSVGWMSDAQTATTTAQRSNRPSGSSSNSDNTQVDAGALSGREGLHFGKGWRKGCGGTGERKGPDIEAASAAVPQWTKSSPPS
jgi:hypothetical protein